MARTARLAPRHRHRLLGTRQQPGNQAILHNPGSSFWGGSPQNGGQRLRLFLRRVCGRILVGLDASCAVLPCRDAPNEEALAALCDGVQKCALQVCMCQFSGAAEKLLEQAVVVGEEGPFQLLIESILQKIRQSHTTFQDIFPKPRDASRSAEHACHVFLRACFLCFKPRPCPRSLRGSHPHPRA